MCGAAPAGHSPAPLMVAGSSSTRRPVRSSIPKRGATSPEPSARSWSTVSSDMNSDRLVAECQRRYRHQLCHRCLDRHVGESAAPRPLQEWPLRQHRRGVDDRTTLALACALHRPAAPAATTRGNIERAHWHRLVPLPLLAVTRTCRLNTIKTRNIQLLADLYAIRRQQARFRQRARLAPVNTMVSERWRTACRHVEPHRLSRQPVCHLPRHGAGRPALSVKIGRTRQQAGGQPPGRIACFDVLSWPLPASPPAKSLEPPEADFRHASG